MHGVHDLVGEGGADGGDEHLDLWSAGGEDQMQGPPGTDHQPLAVAVVADQLADDVAPIGHHVVDAVQVGEEGLAGVGLRALEEPECRQVDEPGGQAPVAQRPDGLRDVETVGHGP